MKSSLNCLRIPLWAWPAALLLIPLSHGQAPETVTVVERGPHHNLVATTRAEIDFEGRPVAVPGRYLQLEDGLNYWDEEQQAWAEAVAEIELVNGVGVARRGRQRVLFAPNVNAPDGAISLATSEGVLLRSSVLALAYYDAASGKDAVLAVARDAPGELLPPNRLVYRDAFTGLKADVVYIYRKSGLEQDVILRESPPDPEEFGLLAEATRLEVLTEFFGAPEPVKRARVLDRVDDLSLRAAMAEPDWVDEELDFGPVWLGAGRALSLSDWLEGKTPAAPIPVGKRWVRQDGRTLLFESADYWALAAELRQLPPVDTSPRRPRQAESGRGEPRTPRLAGVIPSPRTGAVARRAVPRRVRATAAAGGAQPDPAAAVADALQVAALDLDAPPGVVLDYTTLNSPLSNYLFRGDLTYYVTSAVNLSGTTTFEGGAVIKYAVGAALVASGPVVCDTTPHRPVVFTAKDDNSVGETISGSSGNPTGSWYANPALRIGVSGQQLQHLRVAHAQTGLFFHDYSAGTANTLAHAQLVRCATALQVNGYGATPQNLQARNLLVHQTTTAFLGYNFNAQVEHLSVNQCLVLGTDNSGSYTSTLWLTNSLFAGLGSYGNVAANPTACQTVGSDAFQTVGAGAHYLAAGSPCRDAGVTNLSAALLAELPQLTTYPPVVLSNVTLNAAVTWGPQAGRDTDVPDLGYHYPPMDYAVNNVTVGANGVLTVLPGTVLGGFGCDAVIADDYGRVSVTGTPAQPVRFVGYPALQEQSLIWGCTNWGPNLLTGPLHDVIDGSESPELRLRFAEFAQLGGRGRGVVMLNGWCAPKYLLLEDCQLFGCKNYLAASYRRAAQIDLRNNLFRRTHQECYGWVRLTAYNNLFWGGTNFLNSGFTDSPPWDFHDNVFHDNGLTGDWRNLVRSHNAYLGAGQATLGGLTTGDVQLASFAYAPGPFGAFYQAGTTLRDAGSRSAADAGLYHHTARADAGPEGASPVDLGFHYVATGPDPAGLVGQWRLDEGAGSTAADSSGLGHTLTLYNGPTWTTGPEGRGALQCDGVNDHGRAADTPALRLAGDFTISFWMKKHAEAADWSRLVGKGDVSLRNYCVWEEYGGGARLLVQQYNASGVPVLNLYSTTGLALHTWYHVVVVREGAAVRLYLNGVLDAAGPATGAAATSTHPFTLAYAGYHTFFPGTLDDVRLYHRALSAAEVPQLHRGVPRDSDGDGLADWEEDANGNGLVNPGETDPNNPVSDPVSALLDSVKKAPAPEIIQYSYRLTASRDYHTSPRNGNMPDATVTMWWWGFRPGWRDCTGNYTEIYEPPIIPDTLLLGGREDRWQRPFPGRATKVVWEVREGGPGKTYGDTTYIDAPPSAEIKVPKEVCNGLVLERLPYTSHWLTYTRGACTTSHLKPNAVSWPKKTRSVVVSCDAFDKSDGATLDPTADGYILGEPRDEPGGVEIEPSRIWVAGKQLYWADPEAEHAVMLQVALDKPDPVITPAVENVPWYGYGHGIVPGVPHRVALAWSQHPSVIWPRALQADFDAGAEILARDDDGRGGPRDQDDVPCYLEFFLIPAKRATFPTDWNGTDFTATNYKNIGNWSDLNFLCAQTFANIKLVNGITIDGADVPGSGASGVPAIVLSNASCNGAVAMHEYGHTVGLVDRTGDTNMVMYKFGYGGSEVTVDDGVAFYSKKPQVWFDF
jgi:hypothetical protein